VAAGSLWRSFGGLAELPLKPSGLIFGPPTKMIIVFGDIWYKPCYINEFCEDDHFFVFPAPGGERLATRP
jgi:hypothetical protein